MREIRVAAAQFENRDNDKTYNLSRIRQLTRKAVDQGAEIVSFHEVCIPGYSWVQPLEKADLLEVAEPVPDGPSVRELIQIACEFKTVVMAGLLECDDGRIYNCYVTVSADGYLTKFRKLHTFVSPHLSPGCEYNVIDLLGCKVGFLTCYDNNLPENVRITAMMGAEIIFMPHVTGCLPSDMPGRGTVDRQLWDNRHRDPVRLRQEFRGPKGREWLMRWLPTRAYENGVYAVFSNPIGWDYDTVKPGLAMIIDPFGEILVESDALDDDVIVGSLTPGKIARSSGYRYLRARRPELYGKLVDPQESVTLPGWQMEHETEANMDTSFTNSKEDIGNAILDDTDWAGLTRQQQIGSIELEGFVVMPDLLTADVIAALLEEFARLPMRATDYSEAKKGCSDIWKKDCPVATDLIAHPPIVDFLTDLFGDDLICTSIGLGTSDPGHPGIAIHTDSQPYGSKIFGVQSSSPVLGRVLYYLDDLTPDCSPFKVIPRSHLSMHRDGSPYGRMLSHPDEIMVTCKAGTAAIINQKVFHGNYPNHSDRPRRMLAIAYRPAWAGPIDDVEDYDPEQIAELPENIKPFFRSLNTRDIEFDLPNRPDNMAREAAGISPRRWGNGAL